MVMTLELCDRIMIVYYYNANCSSYKERFWKHFYKRFHMFVCNVIRNDIRKKYIFIFRRTN